MKRHTFLRTLIRGSNLTQSAVASRAGITEKHLSRICNGQAGVSEITAQKIADVLGLPEELVYVGMYLESLAIDRGDLVPSDDSPVEIFYGLDMTKDEANALYTLLTQGGDYVPIEMDVHLIEMSARLRKMLD